MNYQKAGGKSSFSDYYHAKYTSAKMYDFLKKRIVFANHNLVTDETFSEVNLIVCRNVLMYFDRTLQNRVFSLFNDSLCKGGVLCLGNAESVKFSDVGDQFECLSEIDKIYRKR